MGLLQSGSAWLASVSGSAAGEAVAYARAGVATIANVTAVAGKTDFQSVDDRGVVTSFEARDYLIAAAALAALGGPPQPGDTITDAGGFIYTVMPPQGQPAWRWWDRWHTRYRIHAKYTGHT